MMNALALSLVLTSLLAAGILTPTTEKQQQDKDFLVKEGHKVVVVQYENDAGGSTKVSISPHDSLAAHMENDKIVPENGKNQLSEKMENTNQKLKETLNKHHHHHHHTFNPKEMVCDAYGKCRDTLASVMEKAKEKTHEAAEKARDKASDKLQQAKKSVKDTVIEKADEVEEKLSQKVNETEQKVETAAKRMKTKGKKEFKEILHHAGEVAMDVYEYAVPKDEADLFTGVLNLMGFSAAYGMSIWVTFASSYVLARALSKQQFAIVQSKIYPVYFKFMAYSVGTALLGHLMNGNIRFRGGLQTYNLISSLVMIVLNLIWIEPRATKAMMGRMKLAKEDAGSVRRDENRDSSSIAETAGRVSRSDEAAAATKSEVMKLNEDIRRLNSYSSMLNILTLVSLTWYLVHLAQRLNTASC